MAVNTDGFGTIVASLESGGGGGGSGAVTYGEDDQTTIVANRIGVTNGGSTGYANTQLSSASEGGGIDGSYCGSLSGDSHNIVGDNNVIAGGAFNAIVPVGEFSPYNCFLGGGSNNSVGGGLNTIVGGQYNSNWDEGGVSYFGFIGGGYSNQAMGEYSIIIGGFDNLVDHAHGGAIVGGFSNSLRSAGSGYDNSYSFIGGGKSNVIWGSRNVIGGGDNNKVGDTVDVISSNVGGGYNNSILDNYSAIGGGSNNLISLGGEFGSIPGGHSNNVTNKYGIALGVQAEARTMTGVTQASGAYAGEAGQRQKTTVIVRGDVQGPSAISLGVGGVSSEPETIIVSLPSSASAYVRAECLARDENGVSKVIVLEGLAVMDDAGSMTSDIDTVATYELGSPSVEWDFQISANMGGFQIQFTTGSDTSFVKTVASVTLTEVLHTSP